MKRSSDENNSKKRHKTDILFKDFEGKFDKEDLIKLRSIGDEKKNDSTFVSKCLTILYKENVSVLSQRNAKISSTKKKEITPDKKSMINNLFSDRLNSLNLSAQEQLERQARFRQLLCDGIRNIQRKGKKTSALHQPSTNQTDGIKKGQTINTSSSSHQSDSKKAPPLSSNNFDVHLGVAPVTSSCNNITNQPHVSGNPRKLLWDFFLVLISNCYYYLFQLFYPNYLEVALQILFNFSSIVHHSLLLF